MTLREVITEKRREFWKDSDAEQMGEELELIVDRIDEIGELVNRLEIKMFNMSVSASRPPASLPTIPEEVFQDVIKIFKAIVAEKKRELSLKESKPSED